MYAATCYKSSTICSKEPDMIYKDDWEETKKRFEAFWACDMIDRCCVAVTAPRSKPLDYTFPDIREPEGLWEKWTTPENFYHGNEFVFSIASFLGESFPYQFINLGPGMLAAPLGSDYRLDDTTIWFGPKQLPGQANALPKINFDKGHEFWKAAVDMTGYFAGRAQNKYVVGMTDLGGGFDIAVSLRGAQELIFDMIERPADVMNLVTLIDDAWFEAYGILHKMIEEKCDGMTCWMPLWSRDRWYPLQCDFGALLSPKMFDEFVIPTLAREAAYLDRALFHLDGPDMVKHADSILDIEGIHAIQWRPTEYDGPDASYVYEKWIPLYRKIQARKKGIVMLGVNPKEIEEILKYVSPKGLYMQTSCDTEEDALDLLRQVEKWGNLR